MPRLIDVVQDAVIVAYREDVSPLQQTLSDGGFSVHVQRGQYTGPELAFHANFRCFMNHKAVWRRASQSSGWTLIMEADFVPCVGFHALPVPVPDTQTPGVKWAYLYVSAGKALWREGEFLRGHHVCPVCYLVTPTVARMLLSFWDEETAKRGVGNYYPYDAHMQWSVMRQGGEAYLPARSYGEHGGLPNPEHQARGVVSRSGVHRADVLAAPLAFLPPYARGSRWRYLQQRAVARVLSLARWVLGRWVIRPWPPRARGDLRLYWLGLKRHLCNEPALPVKERHVG